MYPLMIKVGLAVFFAAVTFFFVFQENEYSEPEQSHGHRVSMQETERHTEVERIRTSEVGTGDPEVGTSGNSEDHQCNICLENMKNFEMYTLLCRHEFHKKCIKIWFKTQVDQKTCPCCRGTVSRRTAFRILSDR